MKTTIPFIDFSHQNGALEAEVLSQVKDVLKSHQYILKDKVLQFELEVAQFVGAKFGVGVASGSDALYLALAALGISAGDEVVTTPFTFFATAGSISRTGARPVFSDIELSTFNLDPGQLRSKITSKTKAILAVHLFGLPCDMGGINAIAQEFSIPVIEDCAQSFGAKYRGQPTGGLSLAGCFSFFPTKNLGGAGDGGMMVTSSQSLADKVRRLRSHGSQQKYFHEEIGINSRLDEIQAAVLLAKIRYVKDWNRSRVSLAQRYHTQLAGLPVRIPAYGTDFEPVYHLYSILAKKRDALVRYLSSRGIGNGVYYPLSLHLQNCYRSLGYKAGDFPQAEAATQQVLSLPLYPEMPQEHVHAVSDAIREFYAQA